MVILYLLVTNIIPEKVHDLANFGVQHIVEPKSTTVGHRTVILRDRCLRLYQNLFGLWKHSLKHGRKSAVDQIFGEIKVTNYGLNSRKHHSLKKQAILLFLLCNLNKAMELEVMAILE